MRSRSPVFTLLVGLTAATIGSAAMECRAQRAIVPVSPEASAGSLTTAVKVAETKPGDALTLRDRLDFAIKTNLGYSSFLVPAAEAGEDMLVAPKRYPPEWLDGPGAFGRNYGAELARHTVGGFTEFGVAAVLHEDPRYYPSDSTGVTGRLAHALTFTLVDRSDSGRRTLAVGNLAGSAAAGFIGTAYYPSGYNDTAHALQRGEWEMGTFAAHNLIAEFAPELIHLARKFRFPDRMTNSLLPVERRP